MRHADDLHLHGASFADVAHTVFVASAKFGAWRDEYDRHVSSTSDDGALHIRLYAIAGTPVAGRYAVASVETFKYPVGPRTQRTV